MTIDSSKGGHWEFRPVRIGTLRFRQIPPGMTTKHPLHPKWSFCNGLQCQHWGSARDRDREYFKVMEYVNMHGGQQNPLNLTCIRKLKYNKL